jgi:hypothetical protein
MIGGYTLLNFKQFSIAFHSACNPQSLSVGQGRLSLPCRVVLMFDGNSHSGWPKHVPSKLIIPRCLGGVFPLLPPASCTVMAGAHWVKAMGATISSHVPEFFICCRRLLQSPPPLPLVAFGLEFSFAAASCIMAAVSTLICATISATCFVVASVFAA